MDNLIAFHSGALGQYPVTEAIRRIAQAGYGGVELNAERLAWAEPHVTPALTRAEREAIRRAATEAGVVISSIAAHVSLIEEDRAARRAAIEFSKGCIDLALDLGTDIAHGFTGIVPPGISREEAWRWAVDGIAEIADYAAARGVKFGIEPVVGMLVSCADEMKALLEDLAGHSVGMNYDPSHLEVKGDDPAEVARRFRHLIVAVHLKDAKGTPDRFEFPPLGQGSVDFDALASALKSCGYTGPLVVEYEAHAYGGYSLSEEEFLGQSLAFVRKHFATATL